MALYRPVHVTFWQDAKVIEDMTPEDKLFYLYLITNPNTSQIGIYQITKKQMAFEIGYSTGSINALMDRFERHHEIIKYNTDTREIAIKNWGRYNFPRAGTPIENCVRNELSKVKDKELIKEGTKFIWAIPVYCLLKGQDGKYECIGSVQEFDGKDIIFENLSEIVSDEFIKQTDEDDALLSVLEIEKIEKETIYLKINKTVLSKNHMDISEEIELIEVY